VPGYDALCLDVARPDHVVDPKDPFAEFDFSFSPSK
jgi:hypothetical protein